MSLALLASVPEEHLISGQLKDRTEGRVAFGSKDWELFNKLDLLLKGNECDVLIHASHPKRPTNPPMATWGAKYILYSVAINGAHKNGMKYRPDSTAAYPLDNKSHWIVFWEVRDLKPLTPATRISLLRGFEKPSNYLKNFTPHGPLLIQAA